MKRKKQTSSKSRELKERKKFEELFDINPLIFQYVQITLAVNLHKSEYQDGQGTEMVKPLVLQGWLIHEDDNYLYLGDEPDDVSFYVEKSRLVYVERVQKTDKWDELLEGATKGHGFN